MDKKKMKVRAWRSEKKGVSNSAIHHPSPISSLNPNNTATLSPDLKAAKLQPRIITSSNAAKGTRAATPSQNRIELSGFAQELLKTNY